MSKIKRIVLACEVLAVSFIVNVSVCNSVSSAAESAPPPMKRTIYMAAIEPKGTTNVSKETFPTTSLPPGEGYGLNAPDKDGNWTVETYTWSPGSMTVYQEDEITLRVIGINGAMHQVSIEGYDLKYVVKRGEITTVSFKADKAGIFQIICHTHTPAMTAQLVVLPRPRK